MGGAEVVNASSGPDGNLDLLEVLGALRGRYGVERLLVEGGPSLNRQLLDDGLVDEIFLTVAPKLLASGAPSIIADAARPIQSPLKLLSAHEADGHLFLRYKPQKDPPDNP